MKTYAQRSLLYLVSEDWYFCSHRLPIARAARDAGFTVHVATRIGAHEERLRDEGFVVHPINMRRGDARVWKEVPLLAGIGALYRRIAPSLSHHVAMKPVVYGALAARLSPRTKVVNALAGLGYLFTSKDAQQSIPARVVRAVLPRLMNGKGRAVVVQNSDDGAVLEGLGVRAKQIQLIRGSGVDIEHFRPQPEPSGVPVAVMVSRLLWNKGVGELAEAARILKARGVALKIVLVGGPDPDNPASVTPAEIAKWQTEGLIDCVGQRSDIDSILAQAHIAVLPSYREGLPKTLLEAAACGRPLVATDVTGCREVAINGRTGITVPARDAVSLADALACLAVDPDLRQRYGAAARALVEAEFSESRVVADTLALYERLLDGCDDRH
jgi:glycosyltransferase involved in cell wall biosynthesis